MEVFGLINLKSFLKNIFRAFGCFKDDRLSIPMYGSEGDDRLSILPDDLIHKILSFIGIQDAIKTSVLSSRWRYIWTSMPYLNFDLYTSHLSSKFVTDVLSHRSNLYGLSSFHLRCSPADTKFVEKVLDYALCNNVQKMTVELFIDNDTVLLTLFGSRSLKELTLGGGFVWINFNLHASAWNLPALTTLHLDHVTFINDDSSGICVDLFSKCASLKNLTLKYCTLTGSNSKGFRISHPYLCNLTITDLKGELFKVGCYNSLQISKESLNSLEKFDLFIVTPQMDDARNLFGLLQHLHRVKFLTLNKKLYKILSSFMELISPPLSPHADLKSLKIYPMYADMTEHTHHLICLLKSKSSS